MFKIIDSKGGEIKVATKMSEIDANYLTKATEKVDCAKDYCIVGLIQFNSLFGAIQDSKKKDAVALTITVLAKAKVSKECLDYLNGIAIGDKIVIGNADLGRGFHVVSSTNYFNSGYICARINNDRELYSKCVNSNSKDYIFNDLVDESGVPVTYNTKCYFIDFKIVPLCDIKGWYKD